MKTTENPLSQREVQETRSGSLSRRSQWPQLTVGGKLGPARTAPEQVRWERPDAERKPRVSASRSLRGGIATVGRGAELRIDPSP